MNVNVTAFVVYLGWNVELMEKLPAENVHNRSIRMWAINLMEALNLPMTQNKPNDMKQHPPTAHTQQCPGSPPN